jgi:hypothetical protein
MYYDLFPKMTGDPFIDGFIYLVGAAILGWILYEIHWHMKYRKEYSPILIDTGVVTDMDYTPPRTRTTTVGKTTTTSTTPAKHEVFIKFEVTGEQDFDDEDLYETVRMDDNITAEYQEVYRVEKANPRNREFMYYNFLSVTSEKGRKVSL